MRDDELLQIQRQAIRDYRLALGLELQSRRTAAELGVSDLSKRAGIPTETLRSYEKGTHQPQLVRLASIGNVYGVSAFSILTATAEYIYRANGEPIPAPNRVHSDKAALRAVVLYCGVTPSQLYMIESMPTKVFSNGANRDVNR